MRRLLRYASGGLVATLLLLNTTNSAHAACLTASEADAFHVRILQTDLMVAGLSCKLHSDYAQFVRSQKGAFSQHASVMRSYFERAEGGANAMDRYITGLANNASNQSLQRNQASYCQQARLFFNEVTRTPHDVLLQRLAHTPDITARRGKSLCAQAAANYHKAPEPTQATQYNRLQPSAGSNRPTRGWRSRIVR